MNWQPYVPEGAFVPAGMEIKTVKWFADGCDYIVREHMGTFMVEPAGQAVPLAGHMTLEAAQASAETIGRVNTAGTTEAAPQCAGCGKRATGIVFKRGIAADVPVCKKCHLSRYAGWDSQSLNTAASATGQMIRNRIKGIVAKTEKSGEQITAMSDMRKRLLAGEDCGADFAKMFDAFVADQKDAR